jgi:hypothetical protein
LYIENNKQFLKEIHMVTKKRFGLSLLILLGCLLAACSQGPKIVAPEIEPPADLIPGYIPQSFELGAGFQLDGGNEWLSGLSEEDAPRFARVKGHNLQSPAGNDILGVYYKNGEHFILITKSSFPGGTLDLWQTAFEESQPKPCDCDCAEIRLDVFPLPPRFPQIQEERTIKETLVAVLKGPFGWTTVFVRGEDLITVGGGISLEENLKIVSSLLEK